MMDESAREETRDEEASVEIPRPSLPGVIAAIEHGPATLTIAATMIKTHAAMVETRARQVILAVEEAERMADDGNHVAAWRRLQAVLTSVWGGTL